MHRFLFIMIVAFLFAGNRLEDSAFALSGGSGMGEKLQSGHALPVSRGHKHGQLEVPHDIPVPSVELVVHPDPMSGWNLEIITTNIHFSPESASLAHVPGEGHAHLHINGDKITRVYDRWFHLPKGWLRSGRHEIAVSLSTNDHNDYIYNGEVIKDVAFIDVPS